MRTRRIVIAGVLAASAVLMFVPVGGDAGTATTPDRRPVASMDLSAFADTPPSRPLRLLFIHHSVGGQLLADPGPAQALADSIYTTHPNGGGLRGRLQAGYQVHETSYGSELGEATDLFDWLPKFRDKMDAVLATSGNDQRHADGKRNEVVVFKSCYPNSRFVGEGEGAGNPAGPELTLANARATLTALLPELARHPEVLFVYLTAPPVAPRGYVEPVWKVLAKKVLGKPRATDAVRRQAALARQFNDWVTAPDGWLKDYPHKNVVVFDLYDVLTDGGASNLSRYPTGDGDDSHPSSAGNQRVAERFVPFLNRAVRRAGLSD